MECMMREDSKIMVRIQNACGTHQFKLLDEVNPNKGPMSIKSTVENIHIGDELVQKTITITATLKGDYIRPLKHEVE